MSENLNKPSNDLALSKHYQDVGTRYNRLYHKLFGNQREKISQYLVEKFIGAGSKGRTIADIGGGTGETIELLKKHLDPSNHFILVDPYEAMLDQAGLRKGKPDQLIKSSAEEFVADPKWKNQFDILICQEMIHHIGDHRSFFEKVLNILKKSGKMIIITRPTEVEFPFGKHGKKAWKDSYPMTPRQMADLLKNLGAVVHEEIYSYPIVIDRRSWMEMMSSEPLFSDISLLTPQQIQEELEEIQRMPGELSFNDNQLFIIAEKYTEVNSKVGIWGR